MRTKYNNAAQTWPITVGGSLLYFLYDFSLGVCMRSSDAKLERKYQAELIERIYERFPDCEILKNDSGYRQGICDLVIFIGPRYAFLEVKRKKPRPGTDDFEPNQEWYIDRFNKMSYAACIYPENEEEVLSEIQRTLATKRQARVPRAKQLRLA